VRGLPFDHYLFTSSLNTLVMAASDILPTATAVQDSPSTLNTSTSNHGTYFERKMGDTEASYFLPSRQTGVNDMYLHLGFRAAEDMVDRSRIRAVWALLRLRHPLLAAIVKMHEYDDVRFVYVLASY